MVFESAESGTQTKIPDISREMIAAEKFIFIDKSSLSTCLYRVVYNVGSKCQALAVRLVASDAAFVTL